MFHAGFDDTDMFDFMSEEIRVFLGQQPLIKLIVDQFFEWFLSP